MTEIPAGVASSEFQLYNTYNTWQSLPFLVIETAIICQISWISLSAKRVNLMFQKQPDTLHFVAEINCVLFRQLKQRGAFSGLCKDGTNDKTMTKY